jgi:hypothetical protein
LSPHLGSEQAQVPEAAAVVLAHLSKNGIDKELAARSTTSKLRLPALGRTGCGLSLRAE